MPSELRALPDAPTVSEHALARLAGFTRMLRDNGFAVGLKESEDAARVLVSDLAGRAADLRPALKALVCACRSDWLKFDQVFDAYWLGTWPRSCGAYRRPCQGGDASGGAPDIGA